MIMSQNRKRVAIAIVSYNSSAKLVDCFASLRMQEYPWELIDLIMVDNNSSDNSIDLAQKSFASVRIIKNQEIRDLRKLIIRLMNLLNLWAIIILFY